MNATTQATGTSTSTSTAPAPLLRFRHADALRADHPELAAAVLYATGVDATPAVAPDVAAYTARAAARLAGGTESEFPEVAAWRRAFSRMGLKPTQYRCASESLLRRLRRHGELPCIHPVVDLCNALSVAYAIPVAALDADRIAGPLLEVRYARGDEPYTPFGGGTEHPAPGEVTFVDGAGQAHARRWTNRQSGYSAVGPHTRRILVVAEALHDGGARDVAALTAALARELTTSWPARIATAHLTASAPEFAVGTATGPASPGRAPGSPASPGPVSLGPAPVGPAATAPDTVGPPPA